MNYNIIEIANTHGGDIDYVLDLIDECSIIQGNFGVKFQIFKPNLIALKDFTYYEAYETLHFNNILWDKIISHALNYNVDIWIDLFDLYSIEILKDKIDSIYGLKLQASVLNNFELIRELKRLNLSNIKLIVNISGYEINEIKAILENLENELNPNEIIIQVGFQSYPTEFSDLGLAKISVLKKEFNKYNFCFADHLDGETEEALIAPLVANLLGCSYIEKHIYNHKFETKYDKVSSLNVLNYRKLVSRLTNYSKALEEPFLNDREKSYLIKTQQIPICSSNLKKNHLLSFNDDLYFRRTDKKGMNVNEIKLLIDSHHILAVDKHKDDVFYREDFKKATIGAVVACRMKSTRLPRKAILKIGKLTSIELCLKNVLKFENVNSTVLATSIIEEDSILKDYTYRSDVIFYQGDPDDVVQRFLDVTEELNIDIVIRLTGDNPYLSNEVLQILLKSHFETGADYTSASNACIGTNTEIYNTSTLKKIKHYFPNANFSEYMTYYITNNPSYFNINRIELPSELSRNYRLTLDYEEDLKLFKLIEKYLEEEKVEYSIERIFEYLDQNPEIAKLNKNAVIKYHSDPDLVKQIKEATTIK